MAASQQVLLGLQGSSLEVRNFTSWGDEFGAGNIRMESNGQVIGQNGQTTNASLGLWYTPITTGIGNSRWIRYTDGSAHGNLVNMTEGVWYQMNVQRRCNGGTAEGNYTVTYHISTNSSGTAIYQTGLLTCMYGGG